MRLIEKNNFQQTNNSVIKYTKSLSKMQKFEESQNAVVVNCCRFIQRYLTTVEDS